MSEYALVDNTLVSAYNHERDLRQYYCVEIPIDAGVIYQYKIWHIEPASMTILVKENSEFLSWIKYNSRHKMKYYSRDLIYPYQELGTKIKDIIFQKKGRLKGHFLVDLELIEEAEQEKFHHLFYANAYNKSFTKGH